MFRPVDFRRKSLWLLLLLFLSCQKVERAEMPITTTSEEARKLFIKGLELYENLREAEAREYFQRALEKDMDFALCHFYLADIAASALDFQTHLKMAVALSKNVSEGERLLIESLRALAENNPEQAIILRQKLVEMYPMDKRAHRFLGYLYRKRDDRKAIEEFQKAIEIDPKYAPAYNNLGYAYRRLGEYDRAIEAFKKYMRLLPDEPNPYDSIADLYTKMGKHEEAIKYYKKAVKLNKAFAFSQRKIGENYIFMGDFDRARKALQRALELSETAPGRVNTYLLIASSYLYENDFDRALQSAGKAAAFAKASDLPDWQTQVCFFKARIYLETGQFSEAGEELQRCEQLLKTASLPALTVEKLRYKALALRAMLAARKKDFDTAFDIAEQLKARIASGKDFKEIERYHRLMGFIYTLNGHPATAIAHFRQGNVNDPFVLFYWAECEKQLGNESKAMELLDKVANWNEHSLDYALLRSRALSLTASVRFTERS